MRPATATGLVAGLAFGLLAANGAAASGIGGSMAPRADASLSSLGVTPVQYRTTTQDYAEYYGAYGGYGGQYVSPRVQHYYDVAPRSYYDQPEVPEVIVRPRQRAAPVYREPVYQDEIIVYAEPAPVYDYRGASGAPTGYDRRARYWRYEGPYGTRYVIDTNNYLGGTPNPPGPSLAPMNPPGCYDGPSDRVECPHVGGPRYGYGYGNAPYARY